MPSTTSLATQDPEGGCVNPGWNPDDVVCDDEGTIAQALGAGTRLPAAFLWSWQGNLLVNKGHVEDVRTAIDRWMRTAPRVEVSVSRVAKSAEVDSDGLLAMVRSELQRNNKMTIVAGTHERAGLDRVKAGSLDSRYDPSSQCEIGQELSANSLLSAQVTGKAGRERLQLTLLSAERGCLVASSVVRWDSAHPEVSIAEGVAEMMSRLRSRLEMPSRAEPSRPASPVARVAPRSQATAVLTVTSEPKGAKVIVDGEVLGRTPFERELPVGKHTVTVDGGPAFVTVDKTLSLVAAGARLDVNLRARVGTLAIKSTPSGAEIVLDGALTAKYTPHVFDKIAAGRHEITLNKPRYLPLTKTVDVDPDKTTRTDVTLEANAGSVRVRSHPVGLGIFVDGRDTGQKTPATLQRVGSGDRTIEVRSEGYRSEPQVVTVTANDSIEAVFAAEERRGTLTVEVSDAEGRRMVEAVSIRIDGASVSSASPRGRVRWRSVNDKSG